MYRISIIGAGNVATQFAIAFQKAGHQVVCICNRNLEKAEQYVYELQTQNAVLTASFRSGYQLEEIRGAALALGMIPAEEAAVMKLAVTVPQPQQEPGFVDNMIWFLEGLFA